MTAILRAAILVSVPYFSLFASAGDRVALVIGVDSYDNLPAENQLQVAVDDANRIAEALGGLDSPFDVTVLKNPSQKSSELAFDSFLDASKDAECAFLYFAGHGVEYFGSNYLLVRDTDISNVSPDVERMKRRLGNEALSLQALVDSLETTGAEIKLVILDCCRDNPLKAETPSGTRSVVGANSGLAQVTPPSGTLISFSADAGQKANDGLFTSVLAEQIEHSQLPLPQVFASTRVKVREISAKWAEEDLNKGIPSQFRRVRHEPAEYVKLDPAAYEFRFSTTASRNARKDDAETLALREQVEFLKRSLEEMRRTGVENETLRLRLEQLEASVKKTKTSAMTLTGNEHSAATRGMIGSRPGEARTFAGIDFVWCPPTGSEGVMLGSPADEEGRDDDELMHKVVLTSGFWMAKTECTQAQWESIVGRSVQQQKGLGNSAASKVNNVGPGFPIYMVSWTDIETWMAAMNDKHSLPDKWKWALPTEAQWEYACRAGSTSAFHFGNQGGSRLDSNPGELFKYSNFGDVNNTVSLFKIHDQDDGYGNEVAPVGTYLANKWGLSNMHGNVWEWCRDLYSDNYYKDGQTDPAGPASGRFRSLRGGSWNSSPEDCRSASRSRNSETIRSDRGGFRPAIVQIP